MSFQEGSEVIVRRPDGPGREVAAAFENADGSPLPPDPLPKMHRRPGSASALAAMVTPLAEAVKATAQPVGESKVTVEEGTT